MDNIMTLEIKLAIAKKQQEIIAKAKYPTGIIIDLKGPDGNFWYIKGVCNRIIGDLDIPADEKAEFEAEIKNKPYKEILDICQKWFGLIYIGISE